MQLPQLPDDERERLTKCVLEMLAEAEARLKAAREDPIAQQTISDEMTALRGLRERAFRADTKAFAELDSRCRDRANNSAAHG